MTLLLSPWMRGAACLALVAIVFAGCDTPKLPDAVNQQMKNAQQHVNQAVENVKTQVLPEAGIDLAAVPPLKSSTCYIRFEPPRGGRRGVFSLSSSQDEASETFPAIYAWATVDVNTLAEAHGQTIPAEVFARRDAKGSVLRSPPGEPVQLKLTPADGGNLLVEVMRGTLVDQETNAVTTLGGKFTGRAP
jgi:hypothetical protein